MYRTTKTRFSVALRGRPWLPWRCARKHICGRRDMIRLRRTWRTKSFSSSRRSEFEGLHVLRQKVWQKEWNVNTLSSWHRTRFLIRDSNSSLTLIPWSNKQYCTFKLDKSLHHSRIKFSYEFSVKNIKWYEYLNRLIETSMITRTTQHNIVYPNNWLVQKSGTAWCISFQKELRRSEKSNLSSLVPCAKWHFSPFLHGPCK